MILKDLLVFLGKPFYHLLRFLIIIILALLYLLGHSINTALSTLKSGGLLKYCHRFWEIIFSSTRKIQKKKFKLPKLKFAKIRPLKIPKIRALPTFLSIYVLKLKLRLVIFRKDILRLLSKIRIRSKIVLFLTPLLILLFCFWFYILRGLPSPKQLLTRKQEVSTKIYDRNGILLYKIFKDKNRTPVPLSKIPAHIRLATLAAEDAEFYSHLGFSIKGIFRSLVNNIKEDELSGGSTITQQLVKNTLLSPEKTITRKLKEIVLAVETEIIFSKDQILEMYLNEVSYGGAAYGIKEASEQYFDKDIENLSLAEAAFLAGLPKSPSKLSPFSSNPSLANEREREVLHLMVVNKYITSQQEEEALKENIVVKPKRTDIKAPHFVMYIRQILAEKYGEEVLEKGGLEVTTTLDYPIQQLAEKIVKDEVEKLKNLRVGNGAALVIKPESGEILAMVGSKDYFDPGSGNVNVTNRLRQPGSSIKVINYAYALANGYTPATLIDDSPITYVVNGQPPYTPSNYDGKFRGKIPLRSALAESRNIPAVKVLASYGVEKMIEQGKKMGITTWDDPSRFGLSLTLGGGDVKLIDLAEAYAIVANYGKRVEINPILKISDYTGQTLEENKCLVDETFHQFSDKLITKVTNTGISDVSLCKNDQVIDPRVAFLLTDILKDNNARAPAFGSNSYLVIPNHPEVAVKTGTSNNLKDNLTLGFNQNYLVAVWVGNNDSSPMARIASGVTGASPIWNKIFRTLLADEKSNDWIAPSGVVSVPICSITATLPCSGCPTRTEWFLQENKPEYACSPDQIKRILEPSPNNNPSNPVGQVLETGASTQR